MWNKDSELCNTVILKLLKSSINLQFVSSVYAMLKYLTWYLFKLEHADQRRLMENIVKIKCFLLVINFRQNARFLCMKQSKEYYFTYDAFKYRYPISSKKIEPEC